MLICKLSSGCWKSCDGVCLQERKFLDINWQVPLPLQAHQGSSFWDSPGQQATLAALSGNGPLSGQSCVSVFGVVTNCVFISSVLFLLQSQLFWFNWKVEYDLENSTSNELVILCNKPVEQSAVPMCMAWYPSINLEHLLLVVSDQYKIKLLDSATKMCRSVKMPQRAVHLISGLKGAIANFCFSCPAHQKNRKTVLGPTYGSPIKKVFILPVTKDVESKFRCMAFINEDKVSAGLEHFKLYLKCAKVMNYNRYLRQYCLQVGLQILPLDGNPFKSNALVCHPAGVSAFAYSHDGRLVFTAGESDCTVLSWETNLTYEFLFFIWTTWIALHLSSLSVAIALSRQRLNWVEKICCLFTRSWREAERGSSTGWVQRLPWNQLFHPERRSHAPIGHFYPFIRICRMMLVVFVLPWSVFYVLWSLNPNYYITMKTIVFCLIPYICLLQYPPPSLGVTTKPWVVWRQKHDSKTKDF